MLTFDPSNEKFLFEPINSKLYRKLFSKADLVLVLHILADGENGLVFSVGNMELLAE